MRSSSPTPSSNSWLPTRRDVEAHRVERLDGRLVVEQPGQERRAADQVAGGDGDRVRRAPARSDVSVEARYWAPPTGVLLGSSLAPSVASAPVGGSQVAVEVVERQDLQLDRGRRRRRWLAPVRRALAQQHHAQRPTGVPDRAPPLPIVDPHVHSLPRQRPLRLWTPTVGGPSLPAHTSRRQRSTGVHRAVGWSTGRTAGRTVRRDGSGAPSDRDRQPRRGGDAARSTRCASCASSAARTSARSPCTPRAERAAMFVREADEAVCLDDVRPAGGSPYLDLDALERALVAAAGRRGVGRLGLRRRAPGVRRAVRAARRSCSSARAPT